MPPAIPDHSIEAHTSSKPVLEWLAARFGLDLAVLKQYQVDSGSNERYLSLHLPETQERERYEKEIIIYQGSYEHFDQEGQLKDESADGFEVRISLSDRGTESELALRVLLDEQLDFRRALLEEYIYGMLQPARVVMHRDHIYDAEGNRLAIVSYQSKEEEVKIVDCRNAKQPQLDITETFAAMFDAQYESPNDLLVYKKITDPLPQAT